MRLGLRSDGLAAMRLWWGLELETVGSARYTKEGLKIRPLLAHTIHFWYIYSTCIYHKNQPNVGNHMDIYQIHGDLAYLPI